MRKKVLDRSQRLMSWSVLLLKRLIEKLRYTIENPSSSMAAFIGVITFVFSTRLGSDLLSIPTDDYFWLLEGVLKLEPLCLALFGYWLLLWVVLIQMLIVMSKAFSKFRFA